MSEKKSKLFLAGSVITFVLTLGAFSVINSRILNPQERTVVTSQASSIPSSPVDIPSTLSPEKIQTIKEMKNLEIVIENSGFKPANITARVNDQVTWINKDTQNHKIIGEGWGKITIGPGEKFTKAFDKAGTFPYSCELQSELKGTVVVVEK